jgi:hypothetical protein
MGAITWSWPFGYRIPLVEAAKRSKRRHQPASLDPLGPPKAACSLLGQEAGLGQREALPGDALDPGRGALRG